MNKRPDAAKVVISDKGGCTTMDATPAGELARIGLRSALQIAVQSFPKMLLRRMYKPQKLLPCIEVYHFEQAANFSVREGCIPRFEFGGFNVFNLTKLKIQLVGAHLSMKVNSEDWMPYRERFPSVSIIDPNTRGGLSIQIEHLPPVIVERLREWNENWIRLSWQGHLIFSSVLGELRREINSTVVAMIDR